MYVGILKLQIEVETTPEAWQKDAKSLCEKLQARFKVVAKPCASSTGEFAIALVSLSREEAGLHQSFDKIMGFCEASGIGRVNDDVIFVDHLDVFSEEESS